LDKNAEEMLAAAVGAALREPKRSPAALPQFSGPVLAKQYIHLYRRLIASARSRNHGVIETSIGVKTVERHPL
jgi:hypothetical protein